MVGPARRRMLDVVPSSSVSSTGRPLIERRSTVTPEAPARSGRPSHASWSPVEFENVVATRAVTEETIDIVPNDAVSRVQRRNAERRRARLAPRSGARSRRRTPPACTPRYASATIPKATGADGRPAAACLRSEAANAARRAPRSYRRCCRRSRDTGAVAPTVAPAAAPRRYRPRRSTRPQMSTRTTATPIEPSAQTPAATTPVAMPRRSSLEGAPAERWPATQPAGEPHSRATRRPRPKSRRAEKPPHASGGSTVRGRLPHRRIRAHSCSCS